MVHALSYSYLNNQIDVKYLDVYNTIILLLLLVNQRDVKYLDVYRQ